MKVFKLMFFSLLCIIICSAGIPGSEDRIITTKYTLVDYLGSSSNLQKRVDDLYNAMSAEERAAQLIMPAASTNKYGLPIADVQALYEKKLIGGVLFLKGSSALFAEGKKQLDAARKRSGLAPLWLSADAEAALLHYKFTDMPKQLPASEQRSIKQVDSTSAIICSLLAKMGVSVNFAPIADNNFNKQIIGNRSYGKNAAQIVPKCMRFMMMHTKQGILTTVKHFPGHGQINGDTHKGLVTINGKLMEVPTFDTLIQNGALAIMVGHLSIKDEAQWSTNGLPSTLSKNICTKLLRDSLGFRGVAFSDAMNMGAVDALPNASFRALCAGIDVAVMPTNIPKLHAQIKDELNKNGEHAAQLTASIKRVIRMKVCLNLF